VAGLLIAGFRGSPAADATLPDLAPRVRSVFPLGTRTGETVEVEILGRNLSDLVDIIFARKDIRAEVLSSNYFAVQARVAVGPNVPTGLHDYRIRTARGTYVGVFHVGSLPGQREVEPNNDLAHAQKITLPVTVDGIVEEADYDVFRFHAEADEVLVFDLLARRAGSTLDGTLGILDERGNELDFNDDYYIHKDPHLEFRVKTSGDYFIRVAGTGEEGSKYSSYRLIAGAVPYAWRMLPVGVRRGSTNEFRIAGLNLAQVDRLVLDESLAVGKVVAADPGQVTFRMSVPASVEPGRYELHVFAGGAEAPLTIPILVSDLEEKLATPSRSRENPQPVTLPVAVSGTLDRKRAENFFSFEVSAGQRLAFDVDSMKLGYLDDPVVVVYTADGQFVASADDRLQQNGSQPPNLDPYLVYKFEKAGRYIVMIRDSAERGSPNYVYRMAIYPVEPDFDLKALTPEVTLYRGKTGSLPVRVRRLGGWDTPIEVWAEDLAPGVTTKHQLAEPKDTIVKDNCALDRKLGGTNVMLPLDVTADAQPGVHTIRLHARGTMNGKTVEHGAEIQYQWESVGKISGPIEEQKLVATVTELPPVLLETPESVALTAGKVARMKVRVRRFDDGKSPLTLAADPALDGVKLENNVLEAGAIQVELRLTASGPVTVKSFCLRAGSAVSPPIEIKMEAAEESSR
jgi:quinohemoprotein amine dehydrogenase alpha subunit-like protein